MAFFWESAHEHFIPTNTTYILFYPAGCGASYSICTYFTAFYSILQHLQHFTAFYSILQYLYVVTAFYSILQQLTVFVRLDIILQYLYVLYSILQHFTAFVRTYLQLSEGS